MTEAVSNAPQNRKRGSRTHLKIQIGNQLTHLKLRNAPQITFRSLRNDSKVSRQWNCTLKIVLPCRFPRKTALLNDFTLCPSTTQIWCLLSTHRLWTLPAPLPTSRWNRDPGRKRLGSSTKYKVKVKTMQSPHTRNRMCPWQCWANQRNNQCWSNLRMVQEKRQTYAK